MPSTLPIADQRMLELMAFQLRSGAASTETDYCEQIGFARQNLVNVRKGVQGFTKEHIRKACEVTGANANWIFGFEKTMLRTDVGEKDPLQLLKAAVAAIETELKPKAARARKPATNTGR